ncbi:hypothetical protein H2198_001987 [Neophaeococcomyces mojaviensis]|uniref:Uncharacterized protein n=1 Tax=Neophaeococcomyces mojaviensis TaxID=3383035 RepID=A0ACC3AFL0_9EURO|nr:hypothetical protein H2198_001987 [Knufia sp. JES_112]
MSYWQETLPSSTTHQLANVSPARTTTYYYNTKTNELLSRKAFDRLTVTATPSRDSPPTPTLSYCSTAATTPTSSPQPKAANMVQRRRTVNFGPVEGAREPFWDEQDVMKKFNSHVKHCSDCYDSLSSWHSGQPLCSRGHGYVVDMNPYFFCASGKPYSLIDKEKRKEKNRILVPPEMQHVSTLFEALENGYKPNSSRRKPQPKPEIVYSQPRPVPQHYSRYEEPDVVIVPTNHRRHGDRERYYEERRHRLGTEKPYYVQREPRRGSLYHEDEERRHRHGEQVIIVPGDHVRYR